MSDKQTKPGGRAQSLKQLVGFMLGAAAAACLLGVWERGLPHWLQAGSKPALPSTVARASRPSADGERPAPGLRGAREADAPAEAPPSPGGAYVDPAMSGNRGCGGSRPRAGSQPEDHAAVALASRTSADRERRAHGLARPLEAGAPSEAGAASPSLITLKPLGYVEQADGHVQAVLAQGDGVAVAEAGDLIASRYRVLKVSPEAVVAADETLAQGPAPDVREPAGTPTPMPPGSQTSLAASSSPESSSGEADAPDVRVMTPIGYVESAEGEVTAIVHQDGEVCAVRAGDYFAGRFRALEVTRTRVKAVEVPLDAGLMPSFVGSDSGTEFWAQLVPPVRSPSGSPRRE